jgi:ribbon-helix-helix protein
MRRPSLKPWKCKNIDTTPSVFYGTRSMVSRKKISTTVYITEEQNEKLKLLNEKTRVPIAEYIRQGIDLVLEKHKGDLPGEQLDLYPRSEKPAGR